MTRVLITGITGFVGSHLSDYLLTLPNMEIFGLTRWRSPRDNIKHCENKLHLIHGDLLDLNSLIECIEECSPEYIFHLAAQSYVPYSFKAPSSTLDINCIGTINLLEAIRTTKDRTITFDPVVHICSSSEVYGQVEEKDIPIKEDTPFRPASPYAVSKVCEDMLGYQYWVSHKIKTLRTRMFTHTGPRRGEVFVTSSFAKQIVEIELGLKPPIIKVGNLKSVRTFADVRDTVRAYWLLVTRCTPGEVYNIGGDHTETVGEMLERLLSLSRLSDRLKDILIQEDPNRLRPSDVTLQIPCSDKFKKATGWKAEIPFSQTLIDMLDYWRAQLTTCTCLSVGAYHVPR